MAADFSELLDANRLRPLWGSGRQSATPSAAEPGDQAKGADSLLGEDAPGGGPTPRSDQDLGDAPPEPQPRETPTQILDKVEQALRIVLGPQALMLQIYMQPLRRALARLEGQPYPPHPLQSALQAGNLPLLIYRLEDSFRGLLRVKERLR